VGPRAVLDAVVKRKIPRPRRESNIRTPIVQPVAQRYTDIHSICGEAEAAPPDPRKWFKSQDVFLVFNPKRTAFLDVLDVTEWFRDYFDHECNKQTRPRG
jgi:hypothetical protein